MEGSTGAPERVSTQLSDWVATPLGHYLLAREQAYFDQTVADIFGFHALQIGLPESRFLAQSRIPVRLCVDYDPPADVIADPHWLPFPENSIDLIVMPHALEFTDDPHQMLREAYRVIRPEGQIVIAGFNPFSLFGARRYFGREQRPPWNGNFIALYRMKDWLTLLGFDVVGGRLDCYVPPFSRDQWLARFGFFERAGDRWWPIAGGVYFLRATKHVQGMRVITPAKQRRARRSAFVPAARARETLTTSVERAQGLPQLARVTIYTDGACKGNPGPGGWGALLIGGEREKELYGGERATTNNRMELTAVIRALESLRTTCEIELFTDSQYVKQGIESWIHAWKRNGWKTADRKPVKNAELWRELDALAARHRVRWHWVRGHSADPGNERADALANRGIDELRRSAGE